MFTFIETQLFCRLANEYLGEDGLLALQVHLLAQPEIGKVIPGSGGVRKLRWVMPGRGRRGGLRVIYFLRPKHGEEADQGLEPCRLLFLLLHRVRHSTLGRRAIPQRQMTEAKRTEPQH